MLDNCNDDHYINYSNEGSEPMRVYHWYVSGFSGTATSLDALAARIAHLKREYPSIIGKRCAITPGERFGTCDEFKDSKTIYREINA